jgi:hypothetical protein
MQQAAQLKDAHSLQQGKRVTLLNGFNQHG